MASFDITPEELKKMADDIDVKADEFQKVYTSIYAAVSELQVTYKGEASETFNKRIEGYRNDFEAAEKALKGYAECVRNFSSGAVDTENELKKQAAALNPGH